MIYVILKDTGRILNKIDVWEQDAEQKMRRWISEKGYVLTKVEITMMGDMILSVE